MKSIIGNIFIPLILILIGYRTEAQHVPVSENYFIDKYSLSAAYAGHYTGGTLFTGFRSDWTGIDGGPKTLSASYTDLLYPNTGLGGKLIYDKAGIFEQFYLMGTYSYSVRFPGEHRVLMSLSAGLYRNTINFKDYYNDPNYNIDPAMVMQDIDSKLKFITDFSAIYIFRNLETGLMFSNITFGDASYSEVNVTFKPFACYLLHSSYKFSAGDNWAIEPLVFTRGGRYIKNQTGFGVRVLNKSSLWASVTFRDPGIWGTGMGLNVGKAFKLSYNFNISSSVALNIFNSHEISIGINIKELIDKDYEDPIIIP